VRAVCLALLCAACCAANAAPITVGSKNFTEGYLLAEIVAQTLEAAGLDVQRRFGLGGTKVCHGALVEGAIDIYPEYTGTIAEVVLRGAVTGGPAAINESLAGQGLFAFAPLGFSNSYVLAARPETAAAFGLQTISDLRDAGPLRVAFSHEFRNRRDGWPALAAHYGLTLEASGIEHGLAYQAIADGRIDITDAYSTDGELARYGLTQLRDDLAFFPDYAAVLLARQDLPARAVAALRELAGSLDEAQMQRLNARAVIDGQPIASVAAGFLASKGIVAAGAASSHGIAARLGQNLLRHVQLTLIAVVLAAIIGVALAVLTQPMPRISAALLYVCGLMQTVPSIALLALMIPLAGIGVLPAIIALFIYALLPIVRATMTALNAIDPVYRRVALAMGMTPAQERRYVLIPLSMPYILAGLRTAAVISIGTATLAAFIGAGGLGEPIVTGLALNDTRLILMGAVPAAGLAIVTDLLFDWTERRLVPAHLRAGR
jgi:osmoprotectant transport system permease protein